MAGGINSKGSRENNFTLLSASTLENVNLFTRESLYSCADQGMSEVEDESKTSE
jgi:hypothetical protein